MISSFGIVMGGIDAIAGLAMQQMGNELLAVGATLLTTSVAVGPVATWLVAL